MRVQQPTKLDELATSMKTAKTFASYFPCGIFRQQRKGMPRNHQLLISRYDQEYNPALRP
jgi:hypothetical protein